MLHPNKADAVISITDSNLTAGTAYHSLSLVNTAEHSAPNAADMLLDSSATHRTSMPALATDLNTISTTEPLHPPLPPPLHQSSC